MRGWMGPAAAALMSCGMLFAQPLRAAAASDEPRHYAVAAAVREIVQAAEPDAPQQVRISFDALGKHFDLELAADDLFAPGARTIWIGDQRRLSAPSRAEFLAGSVRGEPGSRVRLSRRDGELSGVIVTDDEIYFLEPAVQRSPSAAAGALGVYRRSDVAPVDLSRCGVPHAPTGAAASAAAPAVSAAGSAVRRTEIGLVADYEYYRAHGAATAAVMQDTINLVSAIYEAQLGVRFAITDTVVYTTANDPFSRGDANGLLDQFVDFLEQPSGPLYRRDLAHLFTGRDLQSNVIGIAWIGAVCDGGYASGLSQDLPPSAALSVAAHEIGHNFGAGHDPARCVSPPDGYIMQPSLNCVGRSAFSNQSRNDIAAVVDAAQCLDGDTSARTPTPSPTRTRVPGTRSATAVPGTRTATPVPGTRTSTRVPSTRTATRPPSTPTATKTRQATRTATPTGPTRTATPTPTFAPSSLSGLILWLDAGQLGALSDGAAVAEWPDLSGHRHDARQAVAGARPAYRRAVMNGAAAVRFDGGDDHLDVEALVGGSQKRTVFVVALPAGSGSGTLIDLGDSAVPGAGFAVTTEYAARTGMGERVWKTSASRTTPAIVSVRLNGVSTIYLAAWLDGRRLAVSSTHAARVATEGATLIGGSSAAAGASPFAGDIAEVLVYNRGLTEGERLRVLTHLGAKYGIDITE